MTELRLKSSKKPQILTTMSVMVGSHTPLLQKPVLQGVPSGSISSGCITKHDVLRFIRQQRLHESGVVSHIHVCSSCVSQNGTHLPPRHSPLSMHFVLSAIGREAGHVASLPLHVASYGRSYHLLY